MAFGELFLAALRKGRAEPLPPGQPFPSLPGNGGTGRPPGCLPPPSPVPVPPFQPGPRRAPFWPRAGISAARCHGEAVAALSSQPRARAPGPVGAPGLPP